MPRNYKSTEVHLKPDPMYGSKLVTKLINKIMLDGKKSIAQNILYDAMKLVQERVQAEPIDIITQALDNVKPRVEVKSKRVGGATYQVPKEVSRRRQLSLAIRWLVDTARSKRGKPMARRLAEEIYEAYNGQGAAVTKRENVHKMAEANSAYSHFSW